MPTLVSEPFLYLFSSKNAIFHKFLYRTFWYSKNYTYFYFPKWRYKPRMVLKITNLHILRYLPTYWLYLLERYTIDNQWCTHTASVSNIHLIHAFTHIFLSQYWIISAFQICINTKLESWCIKIYAKLYGIILFKDSHSTL